MKVLFVSSGNSGNVSPFVEEQAAALEKYHGVEVRLFLIIGKGARGYLKHLSKLKKVIYEFNPDVVHAHFGLSGLLANLQRKKPVVVTYHGCDINNDKVYRFSRLSLLLSKYNIFVSQKSIDKIRISENYSLIPCAVNEDIFVPMDKVECRKKMNMNQKKIYILFSGSFSYGVKNAPLAIEAVELLDDVELIELKGYTRKEVAYLMNAVDVCLMTSNSEGSPQFIKEAMACNCPIVSVDVGDVKEVIDGVEGCYIVERNAEDIAEKLKLVFEKNKRTNGREKLMKMGLDSESVAQKIITIYNEVLA